MKQPSLLFCAVATLLMSACSETTKVKTEKTNEAATNTAQSMVSLDRGRYLVEAMGCEDCHSPKKMGPQGPELIEELRFSGYPADRPLAEASAEALSKGWVLMSGDLTSAVGPWGQSFAANISSDPTGIGNWSEEAFIACMRTGKSKGLPSGRPLLPPMPWMGIAKLNDDDLRSIFVYLQSTTPVANIAPANRAPQIH